VLINKASSSPISGSPFIVFGAALVLGAWQMFVRSPLNAWHFNPEFYYRSVTAHGSAMGYVFPTLIAMALAMRSRAALENRWSPPLAWAGFSWSRRRRGAMIPVSLGARLGAVHLLSPMVGNPFYYIGRRDGGGRLMDMGRTDAITWRSGAGKSRQAGAAGDVRQCRGAISGAGLRSARRSRSFVQIFPWRSACGRHRRRAGAGGSFPGRCMRLLFRLIPTYIAYYTIFPRAIGAGSTAPDGADSFYPVRSWWRCDRRASLFADPQVAPDSSSCIRCHRLVALPTLLTVFTICASAEIASRLRGGRGAFGWVSALPGKIRSCWRPRCRWSCSASAAPAG